MIRWSEPTEIIASAAILRMPEYFASEARKARSSSSFSRTRVSSADWRLSATTSVAATMVSAARRSMARASPRARSSTDSVAGRSNAASATHSAIRRRRECAMGIRMVSCNGPDRPRRHLGRSGLREQAQLQGKLNVVRSMREAKLFLDALLVRIHRLGTDEQLLADFG